ncbi:PR-1-like protein [Paraphaeosphaeria sporulosa]|uniref:PR-1-like protein n=1 Tax=Paraphaeosphaeria sporulosa TaxID=1460663 RepID=A0A177CVY0_9PLEO|nr:PR-1-like protein [Paraphaeosphaeria sporulosa]OAG10879.1 PR-1-like protein [Paraphaeosphaeria sporulosa]
MRSCTSILLASALALGAVAKPLEKRVMVTEIDLEIVTVTKYVTAGQPAETPVSKEEISTPAGYQTPKASSTLTVTRSQAPTKASSKSTPAPKPSPSSPGYVVAPAPSSSKPVYVQPSTASSVYVAPSSVYVPPTSSAPRPSSTPAAAPSSTPVYGVEHKSGDDQAYLSSGVDYKDAMLWHHNRARANHGASNLEWSSDCESAASTAAAYCDFTHHVVDGQGQNLFTVSGDAYNATAGITESWYKAEADIYGAFDATPNMDTFHEWGHLTQVLWKKTTHVGCVTIDCGSKMTINGKSSTLNLYTVCNYSPPGNYEGEYAANVAAPINSYQGFSWAD